MSGGGSGVAWCGQSGVQVGLSVDMLHSDTWCNVYVAGQAAVVSGPLVLQVQVADTDTSGSYGDPTSGIAVNDLPPVFFSGGNIYINSGGTGGVYSTFVSGNAVLSGFMAFAGFQKTRRFARLLFNSGLYVGSLQAGFISNLRTTGSGGGFTLSPSSGTVSV